LFLIFFINLVVLDIIGR